MTVPDPDILAHGAVRRRRAGPNGVGAALAVAAIIGGAVFLDSRSTSDPGSAATASPSTSAAAPTQPTPAAAPPPQTAVSRWLDTQPIGPPLQQRLIVDGRLVDPSSGADRTVAALPITRASAQETPHGTFIQGDALDGGDPTRHWALIAPGASVPHSTGFGNVGTIRLDADYTRAAYTRHDLNGTPDNPADDVVTVELATFPEMQVIQQHRLETVAPADVSGFVGQRVLLTRGDGADVATLIWTPGGTLRVADRRWTSTIATSPAHSVAVLRQGDGTCGHLVQVGRSVPAPGHVDACLVSASFSSDGSLLASLEQEPLAGNEPDLLRITELPGGRVVGTMQLVVPNPTVATLLPLYREGVLVLIEDVVGDLYGDAQVRYAVVRCMPAGSRCEVAWRSDELRGFRQVSIVVPHPRIRGA